MTAATVIQLWFHGGLQTFTLQDSFFFGRHEARKRRYCRLSHHQPPTGACIWVSTAMVVPFRPCAVSSSCHLTVYFISLLLAEYYQAKCFSYHWDEEFLSQHPPTLRWWSLLADTVRETLTPFTIFKALPLANVNSCRPHHPSAEKTPPMKLRKCR